MGEELKPCPFCGDSMSVTASGMAVHIEPGDCIVGAMGIPADHSKSLERWNTRTDAQSATIEALVEALEKCAAPCGNWNLQDVVDIATEALDKAKAG